MPDILIAEGSPEGFTDDIHVLGTRWFADPHLLMASEDGAQQVIVELSSSLFYPDNTILVIIDPPADVLRDSARQIEELKERMPVIIYLTSPAAGKFPFKGTLIHLEKEKKKRFKNRVLELLKRHGKVMTDKAYAAFSDRIKDEALLEQEILKLINYAGDRKKIDSKDVGLLVTDTHEESLLSLFQAFSEDKTGELFAVFENLIANGLPTLVIESFVVRQIRLLLHAKDIEDPGIAGNNYPLFQKFFGKWKTAFPMKPLEKKHYLPYQKPFYAYNLAKTSSVVHKKALLALFDALARYDRIVKSGTEQERIRLEWALLQG